MNEDTEALFAAYLAEHPEAQGIADAFAGVCGRCEETFAADGSNAMPPAMAAPGRFFAERRLSFLRYAAMLLIGALAGLGVGRLGQPKWQSVSLVPEPMAAETKSGAASFANIQDGFWKEKADALRKPRLWAVDTKTNSNESFWGRYRKELSYGKTDAE
jgi:hypothetical protein